MIQGVTPLEMLQKRYLVVMVAVSSHDDPCSSVCMCACVWYGCVFGAVVCFVWLCVCMGWVILSRPSYD